MENLYPMNPLQLRQSIRRMFNGTAREVISELLQNCQRAGATKVLIEAEKTENDTYIITFKDNGKGINSIKDFENLISLGDSGFSEEVIKEQKPAGLGINSILAHEACLNDIKISGEEYSIKINKNKWWEDISYWQNWKSLVKPEKTKLTLTWHYSISFEVTSNFYNEIHKELLYCSKLNTNTYQLSVTAGYDSYFSIKYKYFDTVKNKIEKINLLTNYFDYIHYDFLFSFEYKKGRVIISDTAFYPAYYTKVINWYGQIIPILKDVKNNFPAIGIYYECSKNTESNLVPLNPTRNKIIKNEAYEEFIEAISLKLIDYINEEFKIPFIDSLEEIDLNKKKNKKANLVKGIIEFLVSVGKEDYINKLESVVLRNCLTGNLEFISKKRLYNTVIIKDEKITILDLTTKTVHSEMFIKVNDFKEDLEAYTNLQIYTPSYLQNQGLKDSDFSELFWMCNKLDNTDLKDVDISFRDLGTLYICSLNNDLKNIFNLDDKSQYLLLNHLCRFHLFKSSEILAYEEVPTYDSLEECNVYLGLKENNKSKIIESLNRLIDLYDPECFYEGESSSDAFIDDIIKPIQREIKGNTVSSNFSLWDLQLIISKNNSALLSNIRITNVEYVYSDTYLLESIKVKYINLLEKDEDNKNIEQEQILDLD